MTTQQMAAMILDRKEQMARLSNMAEYQYEVGNVVAGDLLYAKCERIERMNDFLITSLMRTQRGVRPVTFTMHGVNDFDGIRSELTAKCM